MSPRYLRDLVARLARQAGIQKQISPHALRHTFATNELRRGVPIHQLQADLGHSDLSTTAVYLHVVDKEREASANGRPPIALPGSLAAKGVSRV
jgi:integrase/recombinase XerD